MSAILLLMTRTGVALTAFSVASSAGAQNDMEWNSVDGGGAVMTGAGWSLSGTVGQCDAGELAGAGWSFSGGFWPGVPMAACAGDVDGNGVVDATDLALILGAWGPVVAASPADVDGSGSVDATDLAIVLGAWGACE
jgi:Dockerin type I domain